MAVRDEKMYLHFITLQQLHYVCSSFLDSLLPVYIELFGFCIISQLQPVCSLTDHRPCVCVQVWYPFIN